jgi:hypothetical protein
VSAYEVGDRVRCTKWTDENYVGPIRRIDDDGDLYVTLDGHWVEQQLSPADVEPQVDW